MSDDKLNNSKEFEDEISDEDFDANYDRRRAELLEKLEPITDELLRLTETYLRDIMPLLYSRQAMKKESVDHMNLLLNHSVAAKLSAIEAGITVLAPHFVLTAIQNRFGALSDSEKAEAAPIVEAEDRMAVPLPDMVKMLSAIQRPQRKAHRGNRGKSLGEWLERYEELRVTNPELTLKEFARRRGLNYRSLVSLRTEQRNAEKSTKRGKARSE